MELMIRSGQVKFHDGLENLLQPIDSVQPHPDNYNNGDIETITESMATNGMYRPVYVQKSTGYILAGNHTWQSCKEQGATVVPVVTIDCDDMTAARIMIVDNRAASLAQPDYPQLLNLLDKITENDTLVGTGYQTNDQEVIRQLAEIALKNDEFGTWPTFSVKLHPTVMKAFMTMTREADTDADRIEVLMRLAGWEG